MAGLAPGRRLFSLSACSRSSLVSFYTTRTVSWERGSVKMIDQTLLPTRLKFVTLTTPDQVADAIRRMVVRGAPAIGVAAAMGVALAVTHSKASGLSELRREVGAAGAMLRSTRPTAVNLFWGVDRVEKAVARSGSVREAKENAGSLAKRMEDEDVEANMRLGKAGAVLIDDGDTVLTQCNAGALATVGYGTALGVVRAAREAGKMVKVLVPETRPALQGARLTAFELASDGIDCTVISDTAVGHMLSIGRADKAVVGADRITRDGWVFNKIGTYQEAVLSKRHGVPFFVAAPASTFDFERTHEQVVIEEREMDEVAKVKGRRVVPRGVPIANPAFDATPPDLVSALVSDRGVLRPPLPAAIAKMG